MAGRVGRRRGGILGLAGELAEHGGAIEYDLITRAGMSFDDVPARLSWRALGVFVRHLDASSAYVREVEPERAPWLGTERIPSMLADLFDMVAVLDWHLVCANTPRGKQRPRRPKPYPRPWRAKDGGTRVGRDPIPVSDFNEWWNGGDS